MANHMSNGKVMIIHLIVGLIKNEYNPYIKWLIFQNHIVKIKIELKRKVELELSNYLTKSNLNLNLKEIKDIKWKIFNHDNYFTTKGFNKLTEENFVKRLKKKKKLAIKDDISAFVKKKHCDEKL